VWGGAQAGTAVVGAHEAALCPEGARRTRRSTRDGTVRIRESVPARVAQPPGFAGVRFFGTVRAERTGPAESPANGFAGGAPSGANRSP
jgi:hypothetical protein